MKSYRYTIKGLDCANCANKIQTALENKEEYDDVVVNFSTSKLSLKTDIEGDVRETLQKEIKSIEPEVILLEANEVIEKTERTGLDILRLVIGVLIYLIGMNGALISRFGANFTTICTVVAFVVLLSKTTVKAFRELKSKTIDENFLITISCIGAYFVGEAKEGIMVITLYEIGKILESKAIGKTRKSIADLMDIRPEYANLKNGKTVSPEEVKIGDIIIVKAGEKIPLDGVIVSGETEIDNSALTGESKLVKAVKGATVLSGGININGVIEIEVQKNYENSTVNQILNLVENATDKKARTETFVARAAKIYTPIVIALAAAVAILLPLITGESYSESIYKALVFLVISCPCSIAISVPLSYFTGIGKASKKGILIKGSDYLDALKDVDEVIFDKTGTITTGKFEVENVELLSKSYSAEEVYKYLGLGESLSKHPIAESIVRKVNKELKDFKQQKVQKYKEVSGKGIEYEFEDKKIKIGNAKFVGEDEEEKKIGTILYLKVNNEIAAKIILNDEIKPGTKEAIKELSRRHIITKILTGDKKEIAQEIAKKVGVQEFKAEMLPQDKYNEVEKEITERERVAYVGDGINDSPVLARADIGISMGGIGSSSAIEASDVVIMTDELSKIPEAINISKRTNKIIKQNLVFALGVKILILALSVLGVANMWEAVFADVGVTLITILNTIRI